MPKISKQELRGLDTGNILPTGRRRGASKPAKPKLPGPPPHTQRNQAVTATTARSQAADAPVQLATADASTFGTIPGAFPVSQRPTARAFTPYPQTPAFQQIQPIHRLDGSPSTSQSQPSPDLPPYVKNFGISLADIPKTRQTYRLVLTPSALSPRPFTPSLLRSPVITKMAAPKSLLDLPTPSYSNNQFRKDAALIILLREEMDADENELFPYLADEIYGRAKSIECITPTTLWGEAMEQARARASTEITLDSSDHARAFIRRFVGGPDRHDGMSQNAQGKPPAELPGRQDLAGPSNQPPVDRQPAARQSPSYDEEIRRQFQPSGYEGKYSQRGHLTLSLGADRLQSVKFTQAALLPLLSITERYKWFIEQKLGARVDWWPLAPIKRPCPSGYVRMEWKVRHNSFLQCLATTRFPLITIG